MIKLRTSIRSALTPQSPIRKLVPLAIEAKKRGVKLISLNIGEPDLASPRAFFDGLQKLSLTNIPYENSIGSVEFREEWVRFLKQRYGVALDKNGIHVTTGASEALMFAFHTCCDDGDEILVPDPTYANYIGFASIGGVALRPVPSYREQNFSLPHIDVFKESLTKKTRAVLICNPNNPTGSFYNCHKMKLLLDFCVKQGLFLIVDESYREFVFNGVPYTALSLEGGDENIIVIDSLSKKFSLCGARLGFLMSKNRNFLNKALSYASARLSCPTLEQRASLYMLQNLDSDFIEQSRLTYLKRRDAFCQRASKIHGLAVLPPDGAFYGLVSLPLENAEHFATFLLKDFQFNGESLFITPADGFYLEPKRGRDEIRVAFVINEVTLTKSLDLLELALREYRC